MVPRWLLAEIVDIRNQLIHQGNSRPREMRVDDALSYYMNRVDYDPMLQDE
jgi:hypothetical protein